MTATTFSPSDDRSERATTGMTFAQVMERYLDYLRHEQHASATTCLGYQSGLRRFLKYWRERYSAEPALHDVTADDVRSYLYQLSRQGLRPRTLRGAIYPLRGMFGMAVERGYRADDPARAVKLPKKDAAVRDTVSDAELEQLLAGSAREADPLRRSMLRAVLAVLIYGGLRRQELLDLQVSDVDLPEGRILIRSGKGSKSRTVWVCAPCVDALQQWLRDRPKLHHAYLFSVDRRRRLGEVGLAALVERAKSLADLREHANIKPHAIRHAAATRLLRNGADLRSIQQFLGHSQLQTTAVYLHTDEKQLQRIAQLGAFPAPGGQRCTETVREVGANPRGFIPQGGTGRNQGRSGRFQRHPKHPSSKKLREGTEVGEDASRAPERYPSRGQVRKRV